ncbi:DUF420 domain-containing protein [Olivibacter sitiensis]|uniref:DUF420 domain-containing protein n=1 Tax=Olivibacter sitiensis TaxID=376470 RepID=UPI000481BF80|nr:DUF420 domain-containing protein [Olivibacter sitiensis]
MSDKTVFRLVWAVSIFVFAVVVLLQSKIVSWDFPIWVTSLPLVNAFINGTCSILLMTSFYFIKYKHDVKVHKMLNIVTFLLSSLFLVCYIIFHSAVPQQVYGGVGFVRPVYFFILITHIVLAALVLPLILFSFYSGLKMNVAKHRKLVRWSYPIWLYVTVTGVIVYLMMAPYYNF